MQGDEELLPLLLYKKTYTLAVALQVNAVAVLAQATQNALARGARSWIGCISVQFQIFVCVFGYIR